MAKKSTTNGQQPSLLEALAAAGEEDLAQVETRIAELRKELSGLEEAAKLLRFRLHGRPPKPARTPKEPGKGDGTSLAERIYEYLVKHGKATPGQIAAEVGEFPQAVGRALRHEWFKQLDTGMWTIAHAADRRAASA